MKIKVSKGANFLCSKVTPQEKIIIENLSGRTYSFHPYLGIRAIDKYFSGSSLWYGEMSNPKGGYCDGYGGISKIVSFKEFIAALLDLAEIVEDNEIQAGDVRNNGYGGYVEILKYESGEVKYRRLDDGSEHTKAEKHFKMAYPNE